MSEVKILASVETFLQRQHGHFIHGQHLEVDRRRIEFCRFNDLFYNRF